MNLFYSLLFLLVEVKTEHIAACKTKVIKIFADLLLARIIIPFSPPDLQLNDILLTEIIHNDIRSRLISGLCFNIVVSGSVDDRFQVKQKLFSSVLFIEAVCQWSTNLCSSEFG